MNIQILIDTVTRMRPIINKENFLRNRIPALFLNRRDDYPYSTLLSISRFTEMWHRNNPEEENVHIFVKFSEKKAGKKLPAY